MFRNGNILFPTDFSPFARYAMPYAVAIARQFNARLHLAHILDSAVFGVGGGHGLWLTKADSENLLASMREHAETRLANLVERAEEAGAAAEYHIAKGKPPAETIRLAREHNCDLVVIPTHGRSGFDRMVYGSVCEKVIRQCPAPVLSIKHPEHDFVEEEDLTIRLERVLFPTDFSAFAEQALPYAVSLCREFGATLMLAHIVEVPLMMPEFLPDAVPALEESTESAARTRLEAVKAGIEDIPVDTQLGHGLAHREIARLVVDCNADLVVVPTHGKSGIVHALFGSVAEKTVRLAPCPVLTVRPEGSKAAADFRREPP